MIRTIINVYILMIIVNSLIIFFPQFKHTNWAAKLKTLCEFTQRPIRKFLPADLPFDFAPGIVIILLILIPQILKLLW